MFEEMREQLVPTQGSGYRGVFGNSARLAVPASRDWEWEQGQDKRKMRQVFAFSLLRFGKIIYLMFFFFPDDLLVMHSFCSCVFKQAKRERKSSAKGQNHRAFQEPAEQS